MGCEGGQGQTVAIPVDARGLPALLRVLGPAYLVAVGYMDPGNWATDLAAGSTYGYSLLWVVALSSLMAVLLQSLCCRLGIATGLDLAQACRRLLPRGWVIPLWLLAEVAIVACGLPLPVGVLVTAFDTLVLLGLQRFGIRRLEALVISLVALVGACFAVEMLLLRPDVASVLGGLVPRMDSLRNSSQLYLAAGILGATVMPHNLYLHSSLVQTRRWSTGPEMRQRALRFATLDTVIALALAFLVNASILVLAAGSFYGLPGAPVTDLSEAHRLLSPLLGSTAAGLLFGIALLAAGQSSTLTATLAGQIVMEGFLEIRLPQWKRRLLTRSLALVPAMLTVLLLGDRATGQLLILSQVVLSLQLPFAVLPLVWFCSCSKLMGNLRAPNWLLLLAWITAALIVVINSALLLSLAAS